MSNKLIELKNLTKNFDDQQVLRGINLDIHENEFLTLLGPSGCGKSTLAKHFNAILLPESGTALVEGMDLRNQAVERCCLTALRSPSFLHIKGRSIRYSRNMRCFHILMLWIISVSA